MHIHGDAESLCRSTLVIKQVQPCGHGVSPAGHWDNIAQAEAMHVDAMALPVHKKSMIKVPRCCMDYCTVLQPAPCILLVSMLSTSTNVMQI